MSVWVTCSCKSGLLGEGLASSQVGHLPNFSGMEGDRCKSRKHNHPPCPLSWLLTTESSDCTVLCCEFLPELLDCTLLYFQSLVKCHAVAVCFWRLIAVSTSFRSVFGIVVSAKVNVCVWVCEWSYLLCLWALDCLSTTEHTQWSVIIFWMCKRSILTHLCESFLFIFAVGFVLFF